VSIPRYRVKVPVLKIPDAGPRRSRRYWKSHSAPPHLVDGFQRKPDGIFGIYIYIYIYIYIAISL